MSRDTERIIARLAEPQHGNFTLAQARAVGLTPRELNRRTAAGQLERPYGRLYRVAGTPPSWQRDLLAACFAGGAHAVASHRSAAALWGFAGARTDLVEITCPRWRRSQYDDLVVHECKALSPSYITEVDGIPVTTPALTLLMLGAVCRPLVVEQGLDNGARRGLLTDESVRTLLRRVGRQGRDGAGVLRAILRERDPDRAPCESEKETELYALLRRHGLPLPIPQYEIFHKGLFVARCDFAYVEAKLAIEFESIQHHTGRVALERGAARRNALDEIGWDEIDVTHAALRTQGSVICRQISAHLEPAGLLR